MSRQIKASAKQFFIVVFVFFSISGLHLSYRKHLASLILAAHIYKLNAFQLFHGFRDLTLLLKKNNDFFIIIDQLCEQKDHVSDSGFYCNY